MKCYKTHRLMCFFLMNNVIIFLAVNANGLVVHAKDKKAGAGDWRKL